MLDIKHHTIEQGQGPTLILLHGNGESSDYFEHQIPHFAKQYHVIALDTRGHGQTPKGEKPFSIAQFAEDLNDFMDERGISRAILLGFSDGGNIALSFALKHPEKVEKLIVDGANLFPSGVRLLYQWPVEIGYRIARGFGKRSPKAKDNADMLGLMVNDPHIDPKDLSTLTMPVLVVAGTHDMIKRSHTELIYHSLPKAQLVLLEGDHFVANRHPEAFNAAVDKFLQSD